MIDDDGQSSAGLTSGSARLSRHPSLQGFSESQSAISAKLSRQASLKAISTTQNATDPAKETALNLGGNAVGAKGRRRDKKGSEAESSEDDDDYGLSITIHVSQEEEPCLDDGDVNVNDNGSHASEDKADDVDRLELLSKSELERQRSRLAVWRVTDVVLSR